MALPIVILDPELAPGLLQEQVQKQEQEQEEVQVRALSTEVLGSIPYPCLL